MGIGNWKLENKFVINKEIKTHKDLDVWKNSITLVTKIYEITGKFPKEEIYGIVNQMRRSAVSIPSNIAEGAGRNHKKEFIQFIYREPIAKLAFCRNSEDRIQNSE